MCWYFQGNKPSIGHLQISCGEILFVIFDRKGFRRNSSGKCQTIDLNKFIRIKFFKKGPRNPFHYLCSHSKLKAWTDWFSVWQKKFHRHHKTFPKLASQVVAGLLISSSMPVYPALQSPFAVSAAAVPGSPPLRAPSPSGRPRSCRTSDASGFASATTAAVARVVSRVAGSPSVSAAFRIASVDSAGSCCCCDPLPPPAWTPGSHLPCSKPALGLSTSKPVIPAPAGYPPVKRDRFSWDVMCVYKYGCCV